MQIPTEATVILLEIRSQLDQRFIQSRKIDLRNRYKTPYEKFEEQQRQLGIAPWCWIK